MSKRICKTCNKEIVDMKAVDLEVWSFDEGGFYDLIQGTRMNFCSFPCLKGWADEQKPLNPAKPVALDVNDNDVYVGDEVKFTYLTFDRTYTVTDRFWFDREGDRVIEGYTINGDKRDLHSFKQWDSIILWKKGPRV